MDKTLKNFIVLEGLDGAGTTTQSRLLENYISQQGRNIFTTSEPTRDEIGLFIRKKILSGNISITPKALAHLCFADRFEHLYGKGGIVEHLDGGYIVISDRYFYSTIAYQGISIDLKYLEKKCEDFPNPAVLIFIDTPVDECLKRINSRGERTEIFEKKASLEKVRENYLKTFASFGKETNFFTLDGQKSIDEISADIIKIVKENVF